MPPQKNYHDLIMLDAFNGDYIPEHLMTREYLEETSKLMAENAVVVANTFSISQLYHHESTTYQAVFGSLGWTATANPKTDGFPSGQSCQLAAPSIER